MDELLPVATQSATYIYTENGFSKLAQVVGTFTLGIASVIGLIILAIIFLAVLVFLSNILSKVIKSAKVKK